MSSAPNGGKLPGPPGGVIPTTPMSGKCGKAVRKAASRAGGSVGRQSMGSTAATRQRRQYADGSDGGAVYSRPSSEGMNNPRHSMQIPAPFSRTLYLLPDILLCTNLRCHSSGLSKDSVSSVLKRSS